jgi:peroxiredoxin
VLALSVPLRAAAAGLFVSDFRLTDHLGATHELYYESTAKAVVLVFTSTGSPRAAQTAAALRSLRARFSTADVVVWQIDSDLGADRAAIAAEQALNNNDTPVLVDDAQLVASEYGATRQLETFVVSTATLTLAYHGPLDNADPATLAAPTQNYAADAVAAVIAGGDVAAPRIALPVAAPSLDFATPPTPDYAADVAPIILHSCVQCHSAGNIAPFVYANFGDVQSHAAQVRGDLLTKRMTPWHADRQYGVFANSTALASADIATLFAWCAAGAPRGTAPDPLVSAPPAAGGDWPLGPPDLIVSIPKQNLPATGIVDYRYLTVTVPTTADKWLRAAVVKPGNTANVHHALVFEGTLLDVLFNAGGLGGFFAGYVPGLEQTWFPDGSGKLIHKGEQITFQMHYVTTGQAATDQTQIGFYFATGVPDLQLLTKSAYTTVITIPPGAKGYEREATFTPSTTKDVMLYELNPHMHYRGKWFNYEALYPDGTSEVLLNVPQYDFHWQSEYRLIQPKRLPAGTVIRAHGAYDNSAQNGDNPDPSATVNFGEQTSDEMFVGYINYAELPDHAVAPPSFAGNTVARAQVGAPFSLGLRAANAVARYRADPLPAGLGFDPATGVISGTPLTAGRHAVTIFADNAAGSAATVVDLAVTDRPAAPAIATQPVARTVANGGSATFSVGASAATPLSYQWFFDGRPVADVTGPTLSIDFVGVANAGVYAVRVTNALGTNTSESAILGVATTSEVIGAGTVLQPTHILHPNGNYFDQILLNGTAETITAVAGQSARTSYIDLNDDIVQVEFSGAGTLSLVLDNPSGPAAPVNYNQPSATYMKGHAGIVITGANETTNVSVFTVGRTTAFDPTGAFNILLPVSPTNNPANNGSSLFVGHASTAYDGVADLAFIAISSTNGKFGGLRASDANCFATQGLTGIYAPGVQFLGPVFISDISASAEATPVFIIGSSPDTRITGGDLLQANGQPVKVSGLTQLKFTAGASSNNRPLPAQGNKAVLLQNGVDVTAQIAVSPAP